MARGFGAAALKTSTQSLSRSRQRRVRRRSPHGNRHGIRTFYGAVMAGPHSAPRPLDAVREVPVGRTALWWCLGLGAGMVVGELTNLVLRGTLGLPDAAGASPPVAAALALWPWGLALAAGALLLAGMRPATRITIDRRTAAHIRRTGAPAIATVLRASTPDPGPRAAVEATLLVLTRTGRMFPTDVHWTLDPVDASTVRKRAVVPVRIDPSAPHRTVLDTLADSRGSAAGVDPVTGADSHVPAVGVDPDMAFSARHRLRQAVGRVRRSSRVAVVAGALAGLLLVML